MNSKFYFILIIFLFGCLQPNQIKEPEQDINETIISNETISFNETKDIYDLNKEIPDESVLYFIKAGYEFEILNDLHTGGHSLENSFLLSIGKNFDPYIICNSTLKYDEEIIDHTYLKEILCTKEIYDARYEFIFLLYNNLLDFYNLIDNKGNSFYIQIRYIENIIDYLGEDYSILYLDLIDIYKDNLIFREEIYDDFFDTNFYYSVLDDEIEMSDYLIEKVGTKQDLLLKIISFKNQKENINYFDLLELYDNLEKTMLKEKKFRTDDFLNIFYKRAITHGIHLNNLEKAIENSNIILHFNIECQNQNNETDLIYEYISNLNEERIGLICTDYILFQTDLFFDDVVFLKDKIYQKTDYQINITSDYLFAYLFSLKAIEENNTDYYLISDNLFDLTIHFTENEEYLKEINFLSKINKEFLNYIFNKDQNSINNILNMVQNQDKNKIIAKAYQYVGYMYYLNEDEENSKKYIDKAFELNINLKNFEEFF